MLFNILEPFRDDSDLNTPTLGNSFYPAVEMGWGESKTNNPSEMRSNTRILVPPSLATSSSILAPPTGNNNIKNIDILFSFVFILIKIKGATTSALGEGRVSNAAAKWYKYSESLFNYPLFAFFPYICFLCYFDPSLLVLIIIIFQYLTL